jgi:HEAT repeat protein
MRCDKKSYLKKPFAGTWTFQSMQIISWLSKFKSKTLVKYKAVEPILRVVCPLLAEINNHDEDDVSMDRAAAEVLDTMAINLPKKYVFPLVLEFAVGTAGNPDPNCREASIMALGVITEGCSESMKKKLSDILRLILQALQDPAQNVRGAASFTLGQFAEHLQPEICEHYETVLPCIFNVLSDVSTDVQVNNVILN